MDRRHFLAITGAFGLRMHAQMPGLPAGTTRPDIAAIDHDRILRLAEIYLQQKPTTITAFPAERSQATPTTSTPKILSGFLTSIQRSRGYGIKASEIQMRFMLMAMPCCAWHR